MQKNRSKKPAVQEVHKPILTGSWHGKDAYRMGRKLMISVLLVSIMYLVVGIMLSFDNIIIRALLATALVGASAAYLYSMGMKDGETDAAFAEIAYVRESEGIALSASERERCFHPGKGFFAVLVGVLPFMVLAIGFACIATRSEYTLGGLPGWLHESMRQNEFADALQYYVARPGIGWVDIYRIVVRSMVMPFVNVFVMVGEQAVLWVERLSPVLLCVAPLGYGFGYRMGLEARVRINTGILIADKRKKRKERKERKRRQRSEAPKRLI